jgi:hypothetical protein
MRVKCQLRAFAAVMCLSTSAQAGSMERSCEAARRADKHYNDNNAAEAAVRMTAWESEISEKSQRGDLEGDSTRIRLIVEDIMAFGVQISDPIEGHRTLHSFVEDACE